jgi:exodeoxyribonuclease V alpha subunit
MAEDQLNGIIERITYYSPDSGYTVLRVHPSGKVPRDAQDREGLVAVVGVMPQMVEGENVQFDGEWVENPTYGRQFKAERVIPLAPETEKGVVRYLRDMVYGVGEATARRIYRHFGEQTLHILETDPDRLHEIGIKPKIIENVREALQRSRAERLVMVFLQNYGISPTFARRIYAQYGSDAIEVVKEDPYRLATDIEGIGFKKADLIARSLGIASDSKQRLRAGIVHTVDQLTLEGHTFAPRGVVLDKAMELLEVADRIELAAILSAQVMQGNLFAETLMLNGEPVEAVYLPLFYRSEIGVVKRLRQMRDTPSELTRRARVIAWDSFLNSLAEHNNVQLTPQQQGAVRAAFTSKVSVLTGGPGTGKTTTLQMVINALEQEDFRFALASPTGRAAKRLAEATQHPAKTIHRLLEFSPHEGGFAYDEDNPLDVDVLIIDESSMLDLVLFYTVLKALRPSSHLMLVGDVDQLPSVGAGNVLHDVIESGVGHVTRLDTIFRQDRKSYIVTNAHRINHGNMPYTDNQSDDFYFFSVADAKEIADMVVDVVTQRIPQKFGYHPVDDIQVLAPMYRGAVGVDVLNAALQAALNGGHHLAEVRIGGRVFRKHDKVLQTKNNYEKDVFNGDIGKIFSIDAENKTLVVLMDGREIDYEFKEAEEQLIHAYCISTHRSQGSEYPVVVMPVAAQHYMMLQRNLLYTAITRARKMVVLVGERRAVAMAVNNNKVAERYSGLLPRLKA